jgi:hypothetical protein
MLDAIPVPFWSHTPARIGPHNEARREGHQNTRREPLKNGTLTKMEGKLFG